MTYDASKALDTLVPFKQAVQKAREKRGPLAETREEVLGYTFKPGQKVKDLVTNTEVTILDGQRGDFIVSKKGT